MALFIPGMNRFRKDDHKKVIVTGCGRSGTLYMSKVLTALGFDIGHEGFMADGVSSWYIVEPTRAQAVKDMVRGCDVVFIHIIRSPLEVISSMMRCELIRTRSSLDFFARTNPEYNDLELIERCARYWVEWNKFAAYRFSMDVRLRVDDMPKALGELCEVFLKCDIGPEARRSIDEMGKTCHALTDDSRNSLVKAHGEEVLRTVSLEECGDAARDVIKVAKAFHYTL